MKDMKRFVAILVLMLCIGGEVNSQTRPAVNWYGRITTGDVSNTAGGRGRQLFVGLNSNLWILYDIPSCIIYMAWNGGTTGGSLQTATYWFGGDPHFPHHYKPAGTAFFKDSVGEFFASYTKPADITTYYTKWPKQPLNYKGWTVTNGGAAVAAKVKFKGYFINGTAFKLNFALVLPDGNEIGITETPEYAATGGKTNLVRTLVFTGMPTGYAVRLNHLGGAATAWTATGTSSAIQSGGLVQSANGTATLTGAW
jgi:hypothetical protein